MSTFGLRTSLIAFAAFLGLALTTNPAFARTKAAVTAAAEAVLTAAAVSMAVEAAVFTAAADLMAVAIAGFVAAASMAAHCLLAEEVVML